MANAFNKEERVAFEDLLEGFDDAQVMAKNASVYRVADEQMERSGDTIWRPQPFITQSFDGLDATSNFQDAVQMSVPASLGYSKHVPWIMTAKELRDALQEKRLGDAAKLRLASDINRAVLDVASLQGSLVVKRTSAATGFDDVAQCEAIMNEQGVMQGDRKLALSTRDYNGLAKDLAGRGTMAGKPTTAYERALVGQVASFETFKLDYARRITAAAGGGSITISTLDGGNNHYTPKATSTAGTGETSNVDNRFQTVTVSSTTNVAAGDCFTVATLNAVHHITKQDTGQLKTFRVVSVDSGTTMTITPPMITDQVSTAASAAYKNSHIGTKAANSAIVWLNTVTAAANPFWHKDAIEIIPGRYSLPSDSGVSVMRGQTDSGIELVMTKWTDGNTFKIKFRVDTLFGVVNKNPEMSGIILFGQS